MSGCRRSDEQTLFQCFERQEKGDNCCGNARTSECLQVRQVRFESIAVHLTFSIKACREVFQSDGAATKEQRLHLEHSCYDNNTNSKVLNCLQEVLEVTPIENPKRCEY